MDGLSINNSGYITKVMSFLTSSVSDVTVTVSSEGVTCLSVLRNCNLSVPLRFVTYLIGVLSNCNLSVVSFRYAPYLLSVWRWLTALYPIMTTVTSSQTLLAHGLLMTTVSFSTIYCAASMFKVARLFSDCSNPTQPSHSSSPSSVIVVPQSSRLHF